MPLCQARNVLLQRCRRANAHADMQTCRMMVRWDKAILRYSSRVRNMVIEQLPGIAEIIQPGCYHLVSHFGLGRESVAWADCTCRLMVSRSGRPQAQKRQGLSGCVYACMNDGDMQASHSLEWRSMVRDSAQDAYHSIGRRRHDEGARCACRGSGEIKRVSGHGGWY